MSGVLLEEAIDGEVFERQLRALCAELGAGYSPPE